MMKIALFGASGAGKSTTSGLLATLALSRGTRLIRLRLADPLYQLQHLVYTMCGRPLPDPASQDGELLSVLGQQLRRVNRSYLTDNLAARLRTVAREESDAVVVCDDMRAPDATAMRELGFVFVEVTADTSTRAARRAARGDLTEAPADNWIEQPLVDQTEHRIRNEGSLEDLRERVIELADELLGERTS